jgi:ribosomal protein L29
MSQPSSPLKEQPSPSGNQKKNPMSFLQSIFGKKRMRTQQDGSSTATHQSSCQTLPASNVTTTTAIKAQQPVLPIQRQPRGKHVIIIDDDDDEEDEEEEEEEEAKIEAVDQPPSRRQISLQPNGEDLPMDQSDNSSREFRLNSETPSTPTSTPFVASAKSHGSPSNESNANNDDDNAGATPKRRRILVEPMPNVGSLVRQELHEQQQATTTITMASPPQPEQRERLLNDSNSSVSTVTMPQHEEEHDHPLQHGSSATLEPMVNEQDPETSCDAHMMNDDDDNDDANNSVMSSTSVDSSDTHATDSTLPPPPLIEALKYQCWKCGVSFRQDNAFCFYVMHVHPVLEVPICFVCSRQVMAAAQEEDNEMTNTKVKPEQKQLFKSEEEESRDKETNDFCMGCGEDEEMVDVLFCCDKCPAKFCETCVAKAFGGGEEGVQRTHQLQQETEEWSCPKCQPPLPLEQLQQFVQGMTSSSYKENADGSTPNKKSSLQLHRRPREQVLDEYMKVEQERELVDWLLSPEQVAKKRIEIRNELLKKRGKLATGSSPNKKLSGELKKEEEEEEEDELEGQVESELQVWEQQMQDHDARLTDMSTTLQDEMGAMNVAIPYLAIPELEAKATSVADEPEWKKQADLECIQRQAKEKVAARRLTIRKLKCSTSMTMWQSVILMRSMTAL